MVSFRTKIQPYNSRHWCCRIQGAWRAFFGCYCEQEQDCNSVVLS